MATVHSCADVVLKSESGVSALYDLHGPLSGALTGCTEAVSKENGKRYVIRTQHVSQISKRKQVCVAAVAMTTQWHTHSACSVLRTPTHPVHPPTHPAHPPTHPAHPPTLWTHPRHLRRS